MPTRIKPSNSTWWARGSGVNEGEDIAAAEDELESRVHTLMPFATDRIQRRDYRRPVWDDDGWLEDPGPGSGWPTEIDIRSLSKPPVYQLDRACVANLGVEGDLLLGWRGGRCHRGRAQLIPPCPGPSRR